MSLALITQPNQHDVYAKDLTVTGDIHSTKLYQILKTSCTISGPWAAPLAGAFTAIRNLNTVTITFDTSITDNVTVPLDAWTFDTLLPLTFVNTDHIIDCVAPVTNNGGEEFALVKIQTNGAWHMVALTNFNGVAGTTTGGFSITYNVV